MTTYKTPIVIASFLLVSAVCWGAAPPSQSTAHEKAWENLSRAAQKNLISGETLRLMNEFIKKYPQHPNAVNIKYLFSERKFKARNYKDAAVRFEKFIKEFPRHELSDSAAFRLGESYFNVKADNSAVTAFERVINNYPHSALVPPAMEHLATLHMKFHEWGKADEVFKKLNGRFPEYAAQPRIQENYGIVQYFLEDYSESAQMLTGIGKGKGAYFRGLSLFELTLYEDAVAALAPISQEKSSPYIETAAYLKAEGFFQNKNYNLADAEFAAFIKRFPRSDLRSYADLRRAACGLLLNQTEDAIASANKALSKKSPFEVRVYGRFIKGSALLRRYQYSAAVSELSKVTEVKEFPALAAAALLRKAWAYRHLGNERAFNKTLKALEERYPRSPQMGLGRFLQGAHLYERTKWEDAGARFETAIMEFPYNIVSEAALALLTISYTHAGRQDQLVTAANSALKLFEDHFSSQSLYWRAQSYFFVGKAYYDMGRFKEAVPYFEKITMKHSDHTLAPRSLLMLAWCLIETGKAKEAREKAQILLDNKKTPSYLKINASFLIGVSYFNKKKYDKAITTFGNFIKKNKKHELAPKARYFMGLSYHQKEVFGSAIKEWDTCIRDYPNHPLAQDAYLHIGDLYFKSGEYAKAADFLKRFRKKWPNSPYGELAFWQELQSYFNGKKDEEAIRAYPQFMKAYPESENMASANGQLEMIYYRRGAHGDPKKLQEFISKYPESPFAPAARYKLGDMALEQKAWIRAAQEMEQFIRDYPDDKLAMEAMYGLGMAYENAKEPEKAVVQYQNIMDQYGNKKGALDAAFRLGSLHFKKERYAEAAQAFELALKKRPDKTLKRNLYYNLALCRENMGELEKAADAYGKFAKISNDKDQVRESLMTAGLLLKKAEKYPQAAGYFKELLKDAGKNETELQAVNLLGECYQAAGKQGSAIKTYDRLIGMEPVKSDLRLAGLAQLAYLYEQKKQYKKAVQVYEKISVSGGKKQWVDAANKRATDLQDLMNALP